MMYAQCMPISLEVYEVILSLDVLVSTATKYFRFLSIVQSKHTIAPKYLFLFTSSHTHLSPAPSLQPTNTTISLLRPKTDSHLTPSQVASPPAPQPVSAPPSSTNSPFPHTHSDSSPPPQAVYQYPPTSCSDSASAYSFSSSACPSYTAGRRQRG